MTLDWSERQVPLAMLVRINVDSELAIQYLKWKIQNAIGFYEVQSIPQEYRDARGTTMLILNVFSN